MSLGVRSLYLRAYRMSFRRLALAILLLTGARGAEILRVDLTRERTAIEQASRYPGGHGGSYLSEGRYRLPLSVLGVASRNDRRYPGYVVLELIIENTGTSRFELPVSLDTRGVEAEGNRARRVLQFGLQMAQGGVAGQSVRVIQTADGSESVPSSLLTLEPGRQVQVALKLSKESLGLRSGTEVTLLLSLMEMALDDASFTIRSSSQPVISSALQCRTAADWPAGSIACHS